MSMSFLAAAANRATSLALDLGDDRSIELIDTFDIVSLLVQEAAAHGALPAANAVCKLWRASVKALVLGWQRRLTDEVLVRYITATNDCAEGLTFYHPPSGSALDVHAERRAFEQDNWLRMRFWHHGHRIKGTCLLAVSSACVDGRMVTAEGSAHASWTQIERQKLETFEDQVHVDGFPHIPADAPQARWHAFSDLWPPLPHIGLGLDVPILLLPPFTHRHTADATEQRHQRKIRVSIHGLAWD
mmetsp:Transcript_32410/g.80327  ORF Transcript_32410/g.80327 Transcript_32410/m.80327 type:complete len:244 (-) Transcript_32410:319-1050(-)